LSSLDLNWLPPPSLHWECPFSAHALVQASGILRTERTPWVDPRGFGWHLEQADRGRSLHRLLLGRLGGTKIGLDRYKVLQG
jgi:hypothetical protein